MPKISGYLQTGYQWSDGGTSTFFIKRARLNLQGNITKKLDYRLQIEFAKPQIVDIFVRFKPYNQFNIQVGQFKVPFSIDNPTYTPLRLEAIEYPLVIQKLVGLSDVCGYKNTGRDLGAMVYGGFVKRDGYNIINYSVGVFNGAEINSKDDNKSKDISGRFDIKPTKNLLLSGSYYWGELGKEYQERTRWGVGAAYDCARFVLRGEYLQGTTGDVKSEGWYAVAGYYVTPKFMPVVRYDTFTANRDAEGTRQDNYLAGIVYSPIKQLRLQLNYTLEHYNAEELSNNNVIGVMATAIF